MKLREEYAKFKAGLPGTAITYEQWLEQQIELLEDLLIESKPIWEGEHHHIKKRREWYVKYTELIMGKQPLNP